jgi:hypothetical protein
MSGWVKFEKDLTTDPRVLRMAKELGRRFTWFDTSNGCDFDPCNASALPGVTLVCGALIRLWVYADSHARVDDTLDLGAAEVDELVGIPGFASAMPADWLREIDETTVELPGFQAHNGTEAKKKALTQKRVTRHRNNATRDSVTTCNASALPDQTKTRPRPDQTKGERGADAPSPIRRGSKTCPEDWEPSPWLLSKIETEDVPNCLARGGTTVAMELERLRSCTFGTARIDWDKTAWNWLLTECKKINQKEAMYGANRQATGR